MKKCILSALLCAVLMFFSLVLVANLDNRKGTEEYEHIDYVSTIMPKECYVCSDSRNRNISYYWGEDNVGIVNLNSFEMLYLPINRYGDHGELIEEPAGYMTSGGLYDEEADTYVHAYSFPDNAYASIQISGVKYAIDRDVVQSHLC